LKNQTGPKNNKLNENIYVKMDFLFRSDYLIHGVSKVTFLFSII